MAAPTGKLKIVSTDPRINYNLLPGEKLMTCPYNLSHAILPIKFAKHVLNCHRLHKKERQKLGLESLFEICPHDRAHHVRKEEMEYHKANCKSRVIPGQDNNWGWDDDDDKDSSSNMTAGASGHTAGNSSAAGASGITVAPLRQPPEIDPETLAMIQSEDWEADGPLQAKQFDPDKRINELRRSGYNVIKYVEPGLSKSERKEFYENEAKAMEAFKHVSFLRRIQDHPADRVRNHGGGSMSGRSGSSSSSNPQDLVMPPISE